MNRFLAYITVLLSCLSLTACMYPNEQRQHLSEVNTHIARVQAQAEQYLQQNKVLPYKYATEDRKFTTHYLVELNQLPEIPPTAYEKGGNFIYVFVAAESKQPLVRLFDLRVNDVVEKVQMAVNDYKSRTGQLPIKAKEPAGYYDVDLTKLHMTDTFIPSPYYSDARLPILMDKNGLLYLDYRGDVTRFMQTVKQKPLSGEDLRVFLSKNALFVPAFSPIMKVGQQGEILFSS